MGAISAAMGADFEAHGGTILKGAGVETFLTKDGRVTGVALEDGKVFETEDLLEAAAPIIAATRSMESRGAALPETAAAFAKQAAETARAKLQSQLEKAGVQMASGFMWKRLSWAQTMTSAACASGFWR